MVAQPLDVDQPRQQVFLPVRGAKCANDRPEAGIGRELPGQMQQGIRCGRIVRVVDCDGVVAGLAHAAVERGGLAAGAFRFRQVDHADPAIGLRPPVGDGTGRVSAGVIDDNDFEMTGRIFQRGHCGQRVFEHDGFVVRRNEH